MSLWKSRVPSICHAPGVEPFALRAEADGVKAARTGRPEDAHRQEDRRLQVEELLDDGLARLVVDLHVWAVDDDDAGLGELLFRGEHRGEGARRFVEVCGVHHQQRRQLLLGLALDPRRGMPLLRDVGELVRDQLAAAR